MSNRIPPRAIGASGYTGDGSQFLADDGTWKPGSSGGVQTIVPGTNITVDNSDPANPVVSAAGGGGGSSSSGGASRVLLGTATLSASGPSISVGSIPSGYEDLLVRVWARNSVSTDNRYINVRVGNGTVDAGANYNAQGYAMNTSGGLSGAVDNNATSAYLRGTLEGNVGPDTCIEITIPKYAETGAYRALLMRSSSSAAMGGATWKNSTDAINVVEVSNLASGEGLAAGAYMEVWGISSSTATGGSGGGGSGSETFDDVIAEMISNGKLAHYWPLTNGSGSIATDTVAGLNIALTGSFAWAASPLGGGIAFSGGYGETSGLGSCPTGTAERCMFVIFRHDKDVTNQQLIGYGGTSAGTNAGIELDYNIYRPNIGRFRAGGSNSRGAWFSTAAIPDNHNQHANGCWRFAALSMDVVRGGTGAISRFYFDGIENGDSGSVSVTATGNLRLADNPGATAPFIGDIACAGVFNTYPGKARLDRLYAAFSRGLG